MNKSLHKNIDYINTIKTVIQEEAMNHALPVYDISFLQNNSGDIYFNFFISKLTVIYF